jgi:hypothetical protein
MSSFNLLDIAKLSGKDEVVGLVEQNLNSAPEMNIFPFRGIRGTTYKTVLRTGLPTVAYRKVGAAITASKSTFADKLVQAFSIGGLVTIPKDVAKAHDAGLADIQAIESSGLMLQKMLSAGTQIWYGINSTLGNADGHPGALQTYDSSGMVVDAGGTTESTASSCWLVKFGSQHVQMLVGDEGRIDLSDWRVETISSVPSHVADLIGFMGCQFINPYSVARIKKLTADSGKGLTDSLIAQALAKYPVGIVPDAIFCSRRSRQQLQISRSVVLNGPTTRGGGQQTMSNIAPLPTEAFGIPLYATDSIVDTETLAL